MAITYKILAQATTATSSAESTLYTVPSGKQITVSSITIANTSSSLRTYRIAIVPSSEAGSATLSKHYIAYDSSVAANATVEIRGGITLGAGDVVRIVGSTNELAVNIYGAEIA